MCGASDDQHEIGDEQQKFYGTLNDAYKQNFGKQGNILSSLTSTFSPILAAGVNQQGFSPGEMTNRNTMATEGVTSEYGKAQTATQEALSARGGGDTFLPSGVDATLTAGNANQAAAAMAAAKSKILSDSYTAGRSNFYNAASTLGSTASELNPLGYAGASTSAGNAAESTENDITNANVSAWNGAIGAAAGIGGAALGNGGALTKVI